jgi:protein PhnA
MVAIEGIDMERNVKDCNGAKLNEGDNVQVIKDLPVKGAGTVLKRGTLIKNIHLTDDDELIEGRTDKIKGLVLKTCFLKKV